MSVHIVTGVTASPSALSLVSPYVRTHCHCYYLLAVQVGVGDVDGQVRTSQSSALVKQSEQSGHRRKMREIGQMRRLLCK